MLKRNIQQRGIYCFQDNDDGRIPEKLEKQWKVFENLSSDVVRAIYTDIRKITRGQKKYFEYINE